MILGRRSLGKKVGAKFSLSAIQFERVHAFFIGYFQGISTVYCLIHSGVAGCAGAGGSHDEELHEGAICICYGSLLEKLGKNKCFNCK